MKNSLIFVVAILSLGFFGDKASQITSAVCIGIILVVAIIMKICEFE